ncbi:molecular chaperone DnaJ [Candidatus Saganbacteria bacterium CG08_land_8_20_14_0_20_45_16]|uniref:Molecular chaperone DnaJ n=1 Tax=Candidatus Saganbacteria bacterium CG08_land_8_20_14_0_20_45_16 TaxID=2014293 RepID=A0A2H0Y068_UNCSA|nr:MAG: molecular chaperone DnaJ [Candidatus Saganbacteria bacterium CG08_land_8_20_14_0_20_45_16]
MDLKNACQVLELGETATLDEIKRSYRALSRKWHPDRCQEKDKQACHEKMKEINRAYEIIMKYLENYHYSFDQENGDQENKLESFWRERFGGDPMWGKGWK